MGVDKSWPAHAGFGGGGKWIIGVVLVLVLGGALVGVLFASGVIDPGAGGGLQRILPFVIGPVVLLAVIVPLLLTRRGGGRVALEGDRLLIADKRGRRELPLADLELSLGKLFAGGQYMGSLCHLHSTRDQQTVHLLGSGVELPAERYDAADSNRYRFDYALEGDAFRELVEALQAGGLQPARRGPAAAAARPAAAGEQVFDAVADPSRNVFKIVALSFGAVMFVGILGAVAQSLLRDAGGADATTIGVVMSVLGIGLPAAVIFFMFRRGRGKTILRLSDQAVALERGGAERFRVELPAAELTPLLWRTSSRYGSHNQGPAVRLHDRTGKKLTLGVRDPSQAPASAAKKVGTVDYVLSADAGRALLALLDQRRGPA